LWIRFIKKVGFFNLLLLLLGAYLIVNLLFSVAYYNLNVLNTGTSFFKYFYFSCVTSFTVGYGDFSPQTDLGRAIVILHICFSSISYALIISVLTIKLFLPKKTIEFSKKILVNRTNGYIAFRIINTHREPLINPEIRIFYTEHCVGNVIAKTISLSSPDDIPFLGIHDFTIGTSIDKVFLQNLDNAQNYDNKLEVPKSRFRVVISITGNNGIQQISQLQKYYPNEFTDGVSFTPIQYNEEDQKEWSSIDYSKFGNFWNDFNTIITQKH